MPQVGERINKTTQFAKMYEQNPMYAYAQKFQECANSILTHEKCDLFGDSSRSLMYDGVKDTLKNFFVEESFDEGGMNLLEQEDHRKDMEALFENDYSVVQEYAAMSNFNPVIGMSFPMHKNIMMNNVFDKGVITKVVANAPKFTLTMETRYMTTPDGQELDLWKEQNKLTAAIDSTVPVKNIPLALPESQETDILAKYFGRTSRHDALDISTKIVAVLVKSCVRTGTKYIEFTPATPAVLDGSGNVTTPRVDATFVEKTAATDFGGNNMQYVWKAASQAAFTPYYGEYDRAMTSPYEAPIISALGANATLDTTSVIRGVLSGFEKKNRFLIQATGEAVAVLMSARIDTSNAMIPTCSVTWGAKTTMEEIGTAIPVNTAVSPEEVKDIQALYNVNQLTKIMSMTKIIMGNYKDDKIKEGLDTSFINMPDNQKIARCFDFAPRQGYYADHIKWRLDTFMDALEDYTDLLLQWLNDPNMTITVIGRPMLIRKITPSEYTYQTPSSIGPIELDYVKTVVSTNKKVWQFVSTDKLRGNNNLIIIINPRNTERIVYRIYDYQFYVSNEIRNVELYTLPSIHAFERWKFVEYQPVQGRVKILNPSGLTDHTENLDPIGASTMNDFAITP